MLTFTNQLKKKMMKQKTKDCVIFGLVMVQSALIIYLVFLLGLYNFTPQYTSSNGTIMEYSRITDLDYILDEYSESHEYINETQAVELNTSKFMCLDYSRGLVTELRDSGYDAYIRRGCLRDSKDCHAWVELHLQVEPIIGFVAHNYSNEYPFNNRLLDE